MTARRRASARRPTRAPAGRHPARAGAGDRAAAWPRPARCCCSVTAPAAGSAAPDLVAATRCRARRPGCTWRWSSSPTGWPAGGPRPRPRSSTRPGWPWPRRRPAPRVRRACRCCSAAAARAPGWPAGPPTGGGRRRRCCAWPSRCTRRAGRRRTACAELAAPTVPVLVVQGERDPFGRPEPGARPRGRAAARRPLPAVRPPWPRAPPSDRLAPHRPARRDPAQCGRDQRAKAGERTPSTAGDPQRRPAAACR